MKIVVTINASQTMKGFIKYLDSIGETNKCGIKNPKKTIEMKTKQKASPRTLRNQLRCKQVTKLNKLNEDI